MQRTISYIERIQSFWPFSSVSRLSEKTINFILVLVGCVLVIMSAYYCSKDLILRYAHGGYTPAQYVYTQTIPENFERNFPTGTANFEKSSVMHIYKYAYQIFDIEPLTINIIMIWLEVILTALSIYFFIRFLLPNAPPVAQLLCVALFVFGGLRSIDLANFGGIVFFGHYYATFDILRVWAIIFFLQNRLIICAALLAILVTVHPVHAVFTGILLATIFLVKIQVYWNVGKIISGIIVFCAITLPWLLSQHDLSVIFQDIENNAMDHDTWVTFARFGNYHIFSIDFGWYFWSTKFLPYCALFGLWCLYYRRDYQTQRFAQHIFVGSIGVFILSLLGVVLMTFDDPHPTLLKLLPARSSNLTLLIILPYLLTSLIKDIQNGTWIQQGTALAIPLVSVIHGLFVNIGFILIGFLLWPQLSKLSFFKPKFQFRPHIIPFIFIITLPILSYLWLTKFYSWSAYTLRSDIVKQEAYAYLEAQEWIAVNTQPTALIMLPPDSKSAGQSIMKRSSFGTMRDWIHNCCIYDGNKAVFEEGLKRFGEFNVDIKPFLRDDGRPGVRRAKELQKKLGVVYHSQTPNWYIDLSMKYNINFMIFRSQDLQADIPFPAVYKNNLYVIYRTS